MICFFLNLATGLWKTYVDKTSKLFENLKETHSYLGMATIVTAAFTISTGIQLQQPAVLCISPSSLCNIINTLSVIVFVATISFLFAEISNKTEQVETETISLLACRSHEGNLAARDPVYREKELQNKIDWERGGPSNPFDAGICEGKRDMSDVAL